MGGSERGTYKPRNADARAGCARCPGGSNEEQHQRQADGEVEGGERSQRVAPPEMCHEEGYDRIAGSEADADAERAYGVGLSDLVGREVLTHIHGLEREQG